MPGRNLAFAENLGFVAALVIGFDFQPLQGQGEGVPWQLPAMSQGSLVDAVSKPAKQGEGVGIRIRRRASWEKTQWQYEC
jgi:hypothetical protein